MRRPAIRIVLAPIQQFCSKKERGKGYPLYGIHQQRTIIIDPRYEGVVSTFKHELLHLKHPDWTEDEVEIAEHQWWKKSTWKQKAELLKLLAHAEIMNAKQVQELLENSEWA
jgi:hypothetical protein